MTSQPCVLIPTYNNDRSLAAVVRGATERLPVLVVDDGSTDATAAILTDLEAELDSEGVDGGARITIVRHDFNRGKGSALATGFEAAQAAGFTHAITMDSDGQHLPDDVDRFVEAIHRGESTLSLGARDLGAGGAGFGSRFGCAFSNFWTWVETGQRLPDTQTGFRCYPLESVCALHLTSTGYEFEIEVMVKASWTGTPLSSVPISVRYFRGEQRVSHMRPLRDFMRIAWLNTKLCTQRCSFPRPYLALRSLKRFQALPFGKRLRQSFLELFVEEPGSPHRIAWSVWLGLFMGITPFWGLQIALTILVAHVVGASKTVAVVASNVSFPAMIPFILYGSLVLGRMALGSDQTVPHWSAIELHLVDGWAYFVGSFILATIVATVGAGMTLLLTTSYQRFRLGSPGS